MEGRRKQKWDNRRQEVPRRKSQFKPPHGTVTGKWQPTVPLWEKEFCKVVGSLNWETLLQMKKVMHLYDNVIKWNDSAGKEAFCNAKKRFWAVINGFPCDIEFPNPDLYIDEINWDLENDVELLLDDETMHYVPNTEENKDSVVIFGDSLISNQEFSSVGWGDDEQDVKAPANFHAINCDSMAYNEFGNSVNNRAVAAVPDFCNNSWHYSSGSGPAGYIPWGSGWNNQVDYEEGHQIVCHNRDYGQHGPWGYNNFQGDNSGRFVPCYRNSRTKGNDNYTSHLPKNNKKWNKATN